MASLTFGVAADIGMTLKLQAELVLEISNVYQFILDSADRRKVIILVGGFSTGTNQIMTKIGKEIAEQTTERLAMKGVSKALPVLGVAASAGVNIFSTYIIGRRAQAYFKLGPEAVQDWGESTRAITGIDEQKIITWLTEATERAWKLASSSAQTISGAVIVAGKSAGELIVLRAGEAGVALSDAQKAVVASAGSAMGSAIELSKRADARMNASRNPLVRFYGRIVRGSIERDKRIILFIVGLIKKIIRGFMAIIKMFQHKPAKKEEQHPSDESSQQR
jgi:hypothetical protein